jgi:hypothetical protein
MDGACNTHWIFETYVQKFQPVKHEEKVNLGNWGADGE